MSELGKMAEELDAAQKHIEERQRRDKGMMKLRAAFEEAETGRLNARHDLAAEREAREKAENERDEMRGKVAELEAQWAALDGLFEWYLGSYDGPGYLENAAHSQWRLTSNESFEGDGIAAPGSISDALRKALARIADHNGDGAILALPEEHSLTGGVDAARVARDAIAATEEKKDDTRV